MITTATGAGIETLTTHERGDELKVYVQVPGVVVPAWLAAVFAIALILSILGFLLSLILASAARAENARLVAELKEENVEVRREVRLLQLHVQDVENVLIRYNFADRDDMAPWPQLVRDDPPVKRKGLDNSKEK